MLVHRRHWINIDPAMGEYILFVGIYLRYGGSMMLTVSDAVPPKVIRPPITCYSNLTPTYSAGIDFRRQNLTSVDVRF